MKRRGVLFGGGMAAIVLAIAVPAIAGEGPIPVESKGKSNGLRYIQGTFDPFPGDIVVIAECRDNEFAVGGGGRWSGPATQGRISSSFSADDTLGDQDDGYGWFIEGQSEGDGKTITVFGMCSRKGQQVRLARKDSLGTVGEVSAVKVGCPATTSVIGGGPDLTEGNVGISAPFDDGDRGRAPDDGWRIKASPSGFGDDVDVQAICVKPGFGDLTYTTARSKVGANSHKTLSASCPKGTAAVNGGIKMNTSPTEAGLHNLFPADSKADSDRTPDNRFKATVVNSHDGGGARGVTAYAICLG